MSQLPPPSPDQGSPTKLILRNVSVNYVVTGTEIVVGIFMLPFNVAHLGQAAYGLWMLVASITVYFSMFDAGYGVAQVRFVAKYRAQGDTTALNEVASTMFGVFSAIGLLTFLVAGIISLNLERLFSLTESQAHAGQIVLLLVSGYAALGFPTMVFGGIVNGFQRTYLNGVVAISTTIVVTGVNVAVLLAGYGLTELVAATTAVRILGYFAYARNAYRVFPALRIRLQYFKRERLRQITGFSVFILMLDVANKVNYSSGPIVIGIFIGAAAIAVWTVAQRLIEIIQRMADQLNGALFPVVVDSLTTQRPDRLQKILIQGTRLSLAMVVPLATVLGLTARPLVMAWVGPDFVDSVVVIQILSVAVAVRVGSATSTVVLKGSGQHAFVATSNLAMAIGNLVLSVLLVRWFGLRGVAIGTLVPLLVFSMFVIFPAACRRVGLPWWTVVQHSVWPATWPALLMSGFVLATRGASGAWPLLILQAALAAIIYAGLFLRFAISRTERDWYRNTIRDGFRRSPVLPANGLGVSP